jgi:hypothetical protein
MSIAGRAPCMHTFMYSFLNCVDMIDCSYTSIDNATVVGFFRLLDSFLAVASQAVLLLYYNASPSIATNDNERSRLLPANYFTIKTLTLRSLILSYSFDAPTIDVVSLERGIPPSSSTMVTTSRTSTVTLKYGYATTSLPHSYSHHHHSNLIEDDMPSGAYTGTFSLTFGGDMVWPQSSYLTMDYNRWLAREWSCSLSLAPIASSPPHDGGVALIQLLRRISWSIHPIYHLHHFMAQCRIYDIRGGMTDARLPHHRPAVLRTVDCIAQSSTRIRLLFRRSNSGRIDIRMLSSSHVHLQLEQLTELPSLTSDGKPGSTPPMIMDPGSSAGLAHRALLSFRLYIWYRHRGTRELLRMLNSPSTPSTAHLVPPPSSLLTSVFARAPPNVRGSVPHDDWQPITFQLQSRADVLSEPYLGHLKKFFYRRVCQPPYSGQAAITFRKMISISNVAVCLSTCHN